MLDKRHPGVSLRDALIAITLVAMLGVALFFSGYMTASIRQQEKEQIMRLIYRQDVPRFCATLSAN